MNQVAAVPEERKKPKATVEVIYNGVPKDFPDKPHEKVKKLLDEAIAAFGVVENVHKMALFTTDGVELPDEEWDTVGGLVFNLLGHVPVEGERVRFQGLELRAERVQGRRVVSVLISRLPVAESGAAQPVPGATSA